MAPQETETPTAGIEKKPIAAGLGAELRYYKAFISYSHNDEKFAQKLHRRLERYRLPKSLRSGGKSVGAIFRDKAELSVSSGLDKSIKAALDASDHLIVLCSPHAAQSRWVNAEIEYFKSLGRQDSIFTAILSGVPFAAENGHDAREECLPKALRHSSEAHGARHAEPLAADFRADGDGGRLGTLKLISGLQGVGLDALLQRQIMRARRRMLRVLTASVLAVGLLSALTLEAYNARSQAESRRADAENFVEFLLSDLSDQLESYGRLDLLTAVGERAKNYYAQFDEEDFDPKANGRRARTLHFMGDLQNALGELAASERYFDQAYGITQAGLRQDPQNADRIYEHARSAFWKSLPLRRKADHKAELVYLNEYTRLTEKLRMADANSERSRWQHALAKMNIGRVNLRMGNLEKARSHLSEADMMFQSLKTQTADAQLLLNLTENMAWLAVSYRADDAFSKNYNIRAEQVNLLQKAHDRAPDDFRLTEGLIYAKLGYGNAARLAARPDEAKRIFTSALADTQHALRLEPSREKMRRAQSAILQGLMLVASEQGLAQAYQDSRRALFDLQASPQTAAFRDHVYWDEILPQTLTKMDADFKQQFRGKLP